MQWPLSTISTSSFFFKLLTLPVSVIASWLDGNSSIVVSLFMAYIAISSVSPDFKKFVLLRFKANLAFSHGGQSLSLL